MNVTGATLLGGALTVTGASLLKSDLTVTGGSIVFNTVDVSPSMGDIIKERTFTAGNGQFSPAPITSFTFDNTQVRCFDAIVSISLITDNDTDKYAYYNLKGVQKAETWVLNSSYVGDVTGITFSINTAGQLLYTSTSTSNFVSDTIKFRALTTTV
jgi:hypothetical protein